MSTTTAPHLPRVEGPADPLTSAVLLASAVAGRPVELRLGRRPTHSDGWSITLGPDAAELSDHEVEFLVMAQASLMAVGSLVPGVVHLLRGASSDAHRQFLALELGRARRELREVLPGKLAMLIDRDLGTTAVTGSSLESARRALTVRQAPDLPRWCGHLDLDSVRRRARAHPADPPSQAELAASLREQVERQQDDADDEGERSTLLEKLAGPFSGPVGRAFQNMLGARRSEGSGVTGFATGGGVSRRSGRPPAGAVPVSALPPAAMATATTSAVGHVYPEWDVVRGAHRAAWCTVATLDPSGTTSTAGPAPRRMSTEERAVARSLMRVAPSWGHRPRSLDGPDVDLTAAVDLQVALAAGYTPDPRVHVGERRRAGEIGVLVLLDATESASGPRSETTLFDEHRVLADVLAGALHALDVHAATYAFRTRGRHDVRFLRCKGFSDRWDAAGRQRLWGLSPSGFTRLGAALRHGTAMLADQPGLRHRVLVVIGDGIAYDDGYEGGYATADTARALAEARRRGVACVGLSARPSYALQDLWGVEGHRVAHDPHVLAREITPLLTHALGQVALRAGKTIDERRS
ncbi:MULTISPECIES: hypothetical protein [unclassified Nocardioides]|uniref:hypothetical protein n=1 Tax=unclassified Nocardioides TaxID=2615069 RepID=UPI0006F89EB5|nr:MULTISPECIES: hypothetical protein [unclassified Nocardioides]KRA37775.1 hypothetical protein ASD81_03505 [Nocardioides sp. Root614]KRA91735.1 hypothetical protein ASD84_03770 [Nocardioides sp. Root682]